LAATIDTLVDRRTTVTGTPHGTPGYRDCLPENGNDRSSRRWAEVRSAQPTTTRLGTPARMSVMTDRRETRAVPGVRQASRGAPGRAAPRTRPASISAANPSDRAATGGPHRGANKTEPRSAPVTADQLSDGRCERIRCSEVEWSPMDRLERPSGCAGCTGADVLGLVIGWPRRNVAADRGHQRASLSADVCPGASCRCGRAVAAAHALTARVLGLVQRCLVAEELGRSRVVL